MFVLFDPLYAVRQAALVPLSEVRRHARHIEFTASDRVLASDVLLERGEPWTDRLQGAALWTETGGTPRCQRDAA
jgi:hypothetical protein